MNWVSKSVPNARMEFKKIKDVTIYHVDAVLMYVGSACHRLIHRKNVMTI